MEKINKHIEIVRSTTSGLSSLGEVSCTAIYKLLSSHFSSVGITIINNHHDLNNLVRKQPDLVFLGMKFLPPESASSTQNTWISEYLTSHGIAHTGSNHSAHKLELNKHLAKQRIQASGLGTSSFQVVKLTEHLSFSIDTLSYPVFIKPIAGGGGLGIDNCSVAHNFEDAQTKVTSIAHNHGSDSLIEEYLSGREFTVAILKNLDSDTYNLMPLELIAPTSARGDRILSSAVKEADTEQYAAVTNPVIREAVNTLALDVFHALGARDYGRIDIRLDANGVANFLEANLIPSLLDQYGNFPKACMLNLGIDYQHMILQITELGLARQSVEDELILTPAVIIELV